MASAEHRPGSTRTAAAVASVMLIASLPLLSAEAERTYRWTDSAGVMHYGDHVPPQYAQGAVVVMNRDGVKLREQSAPPSEAERMAATARAEADARRRQHDRFLLITYSSEREILQLRDERLAQIEAQITASQSYLDSLSRRIESLQARTGNFRPYATTAQAPRMPDALAAEIVQTLAEARTQQAALVARRHEKDELNASFGADAKRYRELLISQGLR
jgi:Domain of unknown function (DUF4124)